MTSLNERRRQEVIDKMAERKVHQGLGNVKKLEQKVQALGGNPNAAKSPSTVERVFDVLSRPNYAVAETVNRMASGDNPFEVLKGTVGGLAGKEKTTFDKVIENHTNIGGFAKTALGFAGDVLLDPTTYMGAGLIKGAGKQFVEGAATKALKEGFEKVPGQMSKFERAATDEYLKTTNFNSVDEFMDYLDKGGKGKPKTKLKGEDRLKRDNVEKEWQTYMQAAVRDSVHEARNKFEPEDSILRFSFGIGNKKRTADFSNAFVSDKARKIAETEGFQRFRQVFSTPKVDAGRVAEMRSISEGVWREIANSSLDGYKSARNHFNLNPGQTRELTQHLDAGHAITDPDVMRAAEFIREEFDAMFAARQRINQPMKSGYIENYLPRYFEGTPTSTQKKKYTAKEKSQQNFNGEKVSKGYKESLAKAEEVGLKPITDPWELLARERMDLAATQVKYNFYDLITDNYGAKISHKLSKEEIENFEEMGFDIFKSKSTTNDEFLIPRDISKAVGEIENIWTNNMVRDDVQKFFNSNLNTWKGLVTVVNPSHHVRNIYGDLMLSYIGGVQNPKYWRKASKVVSDLKSQGPIKHGHVVIAGQKVPTSKVMDTYKDWGLKQGFFDVDALEVQRAQARSKFGTEKVRKGLNTAIGAGQKIGESRETFTRLGHFIGAMETELPKYLKKGMDYDEAFERAAHDGAKSVRKWMIDYGDLSSWEQGTAKKYIPFYTFMRKSFPLMLEAMMFQPGKVVGIKKAQRALNDLIGQEPDPMDNVSNSMPKWILDNGLPIYASGGEEPVVIMPDLPIHAALSRFDGFFDEGSLGGGIRSIVGDAFSSSNPMIKLPAEIAMDKNAFTGADAEPLPQHLSSLIPLTNRAEDLGGAIKGAVTGEGDGGDVLLSLIKSLTGSVQDASTSRRASEVKRQESVLKEIIDGLKAKAGSNNG